jgi:hypothetical protein
LTPTGRARLVSLIVDHGWTQRRAAERFNVSPATAHRWVARHRAGESLADRSSRPHHCPHQLIINLRFTRRWGPHRIGYHLGVARSTVGRVLDRYNMPALDCIDQATGLPVRKTPPRRYEKSAPGELGMSTSRNSAGSPTVVGGGCSVAPTNTGHPVEPLERPPEPERNPAEATGTCTMEVDDYSRVLRDPRRRAERHRGGFLDQGS